MNGGTYVYDEAVSNEALEALCAWAAPRVSEGEWLPILSKSDSFPAMRDVSVPSRALAVRRANQIANSVGWLPFVAHRQGGRLSVFACAVRNGRDFKAFRSGPLPLVISCSVWEHLGSPRLVVGPLLRPSALAA